MTHVNNQYLIEAYASPHDGRTRRHYQLGESADQAVNAFHQEFPDRVVRNVWEFVPPGYYATPAISETPKEPV